MASPKLALRISFAVIIVCSLWPVACGLSYAQVAEEWLITKGYFCTLYIKPDVDIEALSRKINTYSVDYGLSEKPLRLGEGPEHDVLYKFDLVFAKVQELLDMRANKLRMDARIYRTRQDIDTVYMEIFNEHNKFIAFYVFKLNTFYGCEEKISAAVLAHEMAHCVVDHYFEVTPPKKIGEMIAHYAELHLREER